jgi:hypothetical protein
LKPWNEKNVFAIAPCRFDGDNPNDLRLVEGQVIEVFYQNSSGWRHGDVDRRSGLFLMTFVDLIPEQDPGFEVGETVEIIRPHAAEGHAGLAVDYGDLVVVQAITGEYCTGHNLVTKASGFFPLSCIRDHSLARSIRTCW